MSKSSSHPRNFMKAFALSTVCAQRAAVVIGAAYHGVGSSTSGRFLPSNARRNVSTEERLLGCVRAFPRRRCGRSYEQPTTVTLSTLAFTAPYYTSFSVATAKATVVAAATGRRTTSLDPSFASESDDGSGRDEGGFAGGRDLSDVLKVAEEAALRAGDIMKATAGVIAIRNTKSNSADLVTESDVECQRVIKKVVADAFPRDRFLGEEDVEAGSEASASALRTSMVETEEDDVDTLIWVVDPIDGTTNFQAGLPIFCTSIGVVSLSGGKPDILVGVIYNPILDEMTSAVKGRGCYLNGDRLSTDAREKNGIELNEALINVGFPVVKESTLRASSRAVSALATKVRGLRMIASASQVMSWVAQGKFNAYVSWDLNSWDVAAGMVVVKESGGQVLNFDGTEANISSRDLIITCNEGGGEGILQGQLREVLEENDCILY